MHNWNVIGWGEGCHMHHHWVGGEGCHMHNWNMIGWGEGCHMHHHWVGGKGVTCIIGT